MAAPAPRSPTPLRPMLLVWYGLGISLLGKPDKVRAEYDRVQGFDPKVAERIRIEFGVTPS